jgi:hypothetical protein
VRRPSVESTVAGIGEPAAMSASAAAALDQGMWVEPVGDRDKLAAFDGELAPQRV